MSGINGISTATASAISGIRAASDALDRSAATIATSSVSEDTVSISPEARAAANSASDDLSGALVGLDEAKYAMAAQVKVLQTTEDISRELLNLVRKATP